MKNILRTLQSINRKSIIVLVLTLSFMGCAVVDDWSPYESRASINYTIVSSNAITVSGVTIGNPKFSWGLQVLEGKEFCSAVSQVGKVGKEFSLQFTANKGDSPRVAVARITFSDGFTKTFTITQLAKTENPDYDKAWAEQPEYQEGSALIHKTYYTTLSGDNCVRNYSICYDTEKLVSHWVAYPLHQSYLGSSGRTDEWSFDDYYYYTKSGSNYMPKHILTEPIIPQSQQWVMTSTYGSGYARGHILPSASRLSTYNTNAQTFYSTNIMPQAYDFNGGAWLQIENSVRSWRCADTLFVVTGTLFENNQTLSKNARTVTVPSHAYKLLLRTKNGNTGKHILDIKSANELKCIGFLYKNNNSETRSPREAAVSVAEIEERTGFKFFRNLAPEIADEVKQQKNLKDWGL